MPFLLYSTALSWTSFLELAVIQRAVVTKSIVVKVTEPVSANAVRVNCFANVVTTKAPMYMSETRLHLVYKNFSIQSERFSSSDNDVIVDDLWIENGTTYYGEYKNQT